jgi:hypothetical protein
MNEPRYRRQVLRYWIIWNLIGIAVGAGIIYLAV